MSGGGKGGSQTSSVTIPKFLQDASERAVQRGEDIAQIGFVPFTGPDVAAFTAPQLASFQGVGSAADAFGLGGGGLESGITAGLPQPQTFAGGIQGFSSAPLFEQALAELQASRPGQFGAISDLFIDPVTGNQFPQTQVAGGGGNGNFSQGSDGDRRNVAPRPPSGGGFTSFADLFDGGGPGASGSSFSGGGILSDVANRVSSPFGGGGTDSKSRFDNVRNK
ncbi:MAG: hypothetical protein JKY32_07280 [Rhizobiales bacterium]|nr:hypothetical protein [Hyphomicrobiales bacterium]